MDAQVVETPSYVAVPVQTNAAPTLWVVVPKGDATPQTVAADLQRGGPTALGRGGTYANVDLRLPRFHIEYAAQGLGDDLQSMGMRDAFSPLDADFSGMTAAKGLYIGEVVQKAMIDVNEEGVEAAAGSAWPWRCGSARREDHRARRPTVSRCAHGRLGAPLFMSIVRDPR